MARLLTLLLGGALAAGRAAGADRVAVRVYMEFGCKHCRRYMTGPLRAAFKDAKAAESMDLQVNPFGNSFFAIRECEEAKSGNESVPGCGGAGGYDAGKRNCFNKMCGPSSGTAAAERENGCFAGPLIYQFGFTQMYTTRFAACAMIQAKRDWRKYVPYFLCVEDKYDDIHDGVSSGEVARHCAKTNGLNTEDLDECYSSREPDVLLRDMALETPEHPGVPWITVNGSVQRENYESSALLDAVRSVRGGSLLAIGDKISLRSRRKGPAPLVGQLVSEAAAGASITC